MPKRSKERNYFIKNLSSRIKNYTSFKNISNAKYLIRLDDSCTTQNKLNWHKLELILDKKNIKPIVAVIPFNKDKEFFIDKEDKNYWQKVKSWQDKGWEIAVHGHSHTYHNVSKRKLILPFYNRSEFGGLNLNRQKKLIKESYSYFLSKKIQPDMWISPGHTFDKNTLIAIKDETEINCISDGISLEPFKFMEIIFFPQQLWFPKKKLFGLWTICLHPNSMNNESIENFQKIINDPFFKDKFVDIKKARSYIKKFSFLSWLYSKNFWISRNLKIFLKKLINHLVES